MTGALASLGLASNIAIFLIAAMVVWRAGLRISQLAGAISQRTGIGEALLGILLLGGVTSLPELATSVTASAKGNTALAVNNILGGVAMQVTLLAVADFAIGRRALTSVVPDHTVLLQGTLNIALLALVAAAVLTEDVLVAGIGLWSWGILIAVIVSFSMLAQAPQQRPWIANPERGGGARSEGGVHEDVGDRDPDAPTQSLIVKTVVTAAIILVAGAIVTLTAETIAEETGLGSSFVGAVLVAFSTSLPELSTVLSAARLGLYTMAISDIFGTNLFDIALLFVVDATAPGPPALTTVGTFAAVASVLGILVTSLYLIGLAERRDRTLARLGIDSYAIIAAYVGGLVILFQLR